MKVFLILPMADGQTGPAIKCAFTRLGHTVKEIDPRLQTSKIYEAYRGFRAELVLCSKTPEATDQLRRIKQEFNPVICVINVDARAHISHWASVFPIIKLSDYHFVVDTEMIPQWKKIQKNTFWLPQGLQDEVYHKPKEITEEDKKKYSCDVCFAGGNYDYRLPFLNAIDQMNIAFKKWGHRGRPKIYNEEHNKMVALSKINFACSNHPENGNYVSVRDYKIMGAGGFLLERNRKRLYKIFPSNILDAYSTPIELVERIRYWLLHDEERQEIAERGYKWVHANATYTHRIKLALDYMRDKL